MKELKELITDIENDIKKYTISLKKTNISKGKKNYMSGMIDSANRILYNIELNYYKTYEEIHEENVSKWRNKQQDTI